MSRPHQARYQSIARRRTAPAIAPQTCSVCGGADVAVVTGADFDGISSDLQPPPVPLGDGDGGSGGGGAGGGTDPVGQVPVSDPPEQAAC